MDQQRLWLAVGLSLLLLVLYQELVVRRYQVPAGGPVPSETPSTTETSRAKPRPDEPVARPGSNQLATRDGGGPALRASVGEAQTVRVETDLFRATLTTAGGRLLAFELKGHRRTVHRDSPLLDLVDGTNDALPLTLQIGASATDASIAYQTDRDRLEIFGRRHDEVVFRGSRPDGTPIEKRFRFRGDSYLFELHVDAPGPPVGLLLVPIAAAGAAGGQYSGQERAVTLAGGKLKERDVSDLAEPLPPVEEASWGGFAAQYFAALAMPHQGTGRIVMGTVDGSPVVRIDTVGEANRRYAFDLFFGPKERRVLATLGHELSRVVDYGWFWFVAIPLLMLLELLHRITGNYGIDIIILTTLVKIATIPLTQTSFRSMKAMQQLQPEMQQLRERFKDDQAELQKRVMELYKRHNVNPLSGCLPMLLQIPIFVGLYNALVHAIELRHAPFVLWINDLSAPDRLMVGGIGIPVLTLLMGASMLVQQWLTPQQGDPTQQKVMMIMPVIFTFMFINFPAGLVLYWLVNNLLTIAQQYWMLRAT